YCGRSADAEFLFQVVDVHATLAETLIAYQLPVQWGVGLDAVDHQLVQGIAHPRQRLVTGGAVGDQLADQRVVVRRYLVTAVQVRVDPYAVTARRVEEAHGTRAGQEAGGVFGVDPALDGVPTDDHILLLQAQGQAATDLDLLLEDVDTGDHLGDRMLHLDTGVHLDEEELTVLVEKLEGAGAAVTQLDTGLYAAGPAFRTGNLIYSRGRRFLDDLLVAQPRQAAPIAQMDAIALTIRQHLNLHVAGIGHELLQVDDGVAEGVARLGAGQTYRLDQIH